MSGPPPICPQAGTQRRGGRRGGRWAGCSWWTTCARGKVKPLPADRLAVALHAAGQGATALCERGRRVA